MTIIVDFMLAVESDRLPVTSVSGPKMRVCRSSHARRIYQGSPLKKKKKKWVAYDTTSQDWRQDKLFHMASVLGRTVSWLVVCGFRSAKFHHHLSGAYPLEKPSRYYLFGPEMLMCAIIIDINLTVRGPIVQYSNTINTQITTSPYLWTIGK